MVGMMTDRIAARDRLADNASAVKESVSGTKIRKKANSHLPLLINSSC